MGGDNNDTGASPGLFRRIDSAIRGIANGLTFGGADWLAGKMDSLFNGTSEQNVAAERAETRQRQSEGHEEKIGEVVGTLAGWGKVVRTAGWLLRSEKIMAAGAGMQLPLAAGATGARTSIRAALWATKISTKTVTLAGLTAGLTWGSAVTLDAINNNWASNHQGEQPSPALLAAAKLAGLAWKAEKKAAGWVWNNVVVPTSSAISGFGQAWAAEPAHAQSPSVPPTDAAIKQNPQIKTEEVSQNTPKGVDVSSPTVTSPHQEATQEDILRHAGKGEALFRFNSDRLDSDEGAALETYARTVMHQIKEAQRNHAHLEFDDGRIFDGEKENGNISFEIDGHVDPVGGASHRNRDLAKLRASAVKSVYEQAAKEEGVEGIVDFTSVGAGAPKTSDGEENWQQRNSSASGFGIKPSR